MATADENTTFDPEINRCYLPSSWSPRGAESVPTFCKRLTEYSDNFRTRYADMIETVQYGEGAKQIMEIVRPKDVKEDTKVVAFIHGGYWVVTSRDMYSYIAERIVESGQIAVNIGYDQAPQVTMTTIVKEIQDAYVYLSEKFPKCKSFTMSGHSAGAHLSAMLLATDWEKLHPSRKLVPINKVVLLSAIPDLKPISHISYQKQLQLTEDEIKNLSPIANIKQTAEYCKRFDTKVLSILGEHDSPYFKKDCKEYMELLTKESVNTESIEIPGVDHFELAERISEPSFEMNKYFTGAD